MALRHLLASACLVLLAATMPATAGSGDLVRQGTYVVGAHADLGVGPEEFPTVLCTDFNAEGGFESVTALTCSFNHIGAGTYVVTIDDTVFSAVAFHYDGFDFGFCGPSGDAVGSVTVTLTADCPGIAIGFLQPVVAGTVTITEA
jgi:hypothetical protein